MDLLILILIIAVVWGVKKFIASKTPSPSIKPAAVPVALNEQTTLTKTRTISASAEWHSVGTPVDIRGYLISGGMLYVGSYLPAVKGYGVDPALIDPSLRVEVPPAGYRGEDMPYWPSYSEVSPRARGLYLRWLSDGRSSRDVDVGIVFLFFYGIERRLLLDRASVTDEEQVGLLGEIERLLSIYGDSRSFRSYAGELRDIISLVAKPGIFDEPPPLHLSEFSMKVFLGRYAEKSEPLPAEWAFAWVTNDLQFASRTSAERCREEFKELFRIKYGEKYGRGVKLRKSRKTIAAEYRPASGSFQGATVTVKIETLPDVTGASEPIGKLHLLANECLDELDGYSRFLGRNPDLQNAPAAIALLPAALVQQRMDKWIGPLREWLDGQVVGTEAGLITFQSLAGRWPDLRQEKIGKREWISLATCLQKMGFGIEPDVRFGSHSPTPDGELAIFRLPDVGTYVATTNYSAASLLLHLATIIAGADGTFAQAEVDLLEHHLTSSLDLTTGERARLRAHTKWLLAAQPCTTGVKKRLEALSPEQRLFLGRFLVRIASVDGHIAPAEMSGLEKLYRLLKLDDKALYSEAHEASISAQEASASEIESEAFSIPAPETSPSKSQPGSGVDMAKVATLAAESDRIAKLLEEVFVSEEETLPTHPNDSGMVESILELDTSQSGFLKTLITRTKWTRAEIEQLAEEHGVLLDGTIEAINDAAFEACNEPLLEGDEEVELNTNILRELNL